MSRDMKRVVSMGGRLEKLLKEAEAEAIGIISEAEKNADNIINQVRQEAEYRLSRAQRGTGIDDLIQKEEKKAKKEAELVLKDYEKKVNELQNISPEYKDKALERIIKEVLPK
jgi:vacuolar-type H+-ATPase subunit H